MSAERHRSSATLLALVYAALVLYASLYPFEGWRWPPGQNWRVLLALPTAIHQSAFDVVSNLLGYLPLGGLLTVAALRSGQPPRRAMLGALLLASALSYGCELLQHFVPARVPAREDLAMNAAGAALGVLLAFGVHAAGLVDRWNRLRKRWFAGDAAMALALLVLWPVGLLFPAPVPLGLGQVGERLRELLADALDGVGWAQPVADVLLTASPAALPLGTVSEVVLIALGLLAPCVVATRWSHRAGAVGSWRLAPQPWPVLACRCPRRSILGLNMPMPGSAPAPGRGWAWACCWLCWLRCCRAAWWRAPGWWS